MKVLNRGSGKRPTHLIVLGIAAVIFLGTVTCAAFLMPSRIDMYYTPTHRPDFVYELWQYLALVVIITPILAVALGAVSTATVSLVTAFGGGESGAGSGVGIWVRAWVLLWLSAIVWLAIWLGNDDPERRSWFELLLTLAGLAGVAIVTALHARTELLHAQTRRTSD